MDAHPSSSSRPPSCLKACKCCTTYIVCVASAGYASSIRCTLYSVYNVHSQLCSLCWLGFQYPLYAVQRIHCALLAPAILPVSTVRCTAYTVCIAGYIARAGYTSSTRCMLYSIYSLHSRLHSWRRLCFQYLLYAVQRIQGA